MLTLCCGETLAMRSLLTFDFLSFRQLCRCLGEQAGVAPTAEVEAHLYLEQVNFAVIGFLIKDFCWRLEWAFAFHHMFSILGCALCALFPAYAGAVSLNAAQCEFASAAFDINNILPGVS